MLTCSIDLRFRDELQNVKRKVNTKIIYRGALFVLHKGTKLLHAVCENAMYTGLITHNDIRVNSV